MITRPDPEKVIKALEYCRASWMCSEECPYYGSETIDDGCQMFADALELLKEQETRVQQAYEHGMRDAIKHPDCEAAEHDATGCLGYGRGEYDDEPIEVCMMCEKYTGNRG